MIFRTIEISDPRYEHEGLREITFKSPSLKGRADLTLFLPRDIPQNLPLVILLHGVFGSHWAWSKKGGAHRTAARLIAQHEIKPVALAMPSDGLWGDGSAYMAHNGRDFEKYIVEEIPAVACKIDPRIASKIFISGLSMGGFGALKLGAKFPHIFSGISAHSSITHFSQLLKFVEEPGESYGITDEAEMSVLHWLSKNRSHLPKFRFDCGTEDLLLDANRELHANLTQRDISHTYEEFPGGHDWDYWTRHIEMTLKFFDSL